MTASRTPPPPTSVPLQYHRTAAVRRWVGWLVPIWVLALGASFFAAGAWDDGRQFGLIAGPSLGLAFALTIAGPLVIRRYRPSRTLRWTGEPGTSGLEVVDEQGRTRARLEDVRKTILTRWTIRSQMGGSKGLALRFPGNGFAIGARLQDGARIGGSEPVGPPCVWIVPAAMWAAIEAAARPTQRVVEQLTKGKRR